jgi:hypothetical protein
MIAHNIKRFWCGYTVFSDELGKETLQQSVKVKVMTYAKTHIVIRNLFYDETGQASLRSPVIFK